MELLQSYEFWVGVGLVVFLLLLVAVKVPAAIGKTLDAKTAAIQAELDEAQTLRTEAQALLASIKTQRDQAEIQAAAMMRDAEAAAALYAVDAKAKLDEQITRRQAMAERKIASAEIAAAAAVKAAAADMAADLAEQVLTARLSKAKSDPLVDKAVAQLAGKFQ
jgi:F-type H+-transporting ATPase subunit b